jgi:hypothetical protein
MVVDFAQIINNSPYLPFVGTCTLFRNQHSCTLSPVLSFTLCSPSSIYLSICLSLYLWPYSPFVGPQPLFQLLNPIHSRYDSLDGGSASFKVSTYTQNNTSTEWTHTTSMPWAGFEPTTAAFEKAKTVHALDDAATVTSRPSPSVRISNSEAALYMYIVGEGLKRL